MTRLIIWLIAIGLVLGAGAIMGDRWGVPDWARALGDRVVGESERAIAEGERLAGERLDEARAYAADANRFAPPEDLDTDDIRDAIAEAIGAEEEDPFANGQTFTDEDLNETLIDEATSTVIPLCPRMTIANAPANADGLVTAPTTVRRGSTALNIVVAPGSCLSSGFGQRSGKLHKGVDFHHPQGVDVFAAGSGEVLEAGYRGDYGNYVVIDHGDGLFTRSAHLRTLDGAVSPGARVAAGQRLGVMGNTASYAIPIHLHLEVLEGDIANPKGVFGLTPVDPFGG